MSDKQAPPWKPSCPVLIGPGALDLIRGHAWMFLAAALFLHVILLILLPRPSSGLAALAQQELLLKLKPASTAALEPALSAQPPELPAPPALADSPAPAPRPGPAPPPPAKAGVQPPPQAAGGASGPGAVIATSGAGDAGGPAIPSGTGSGGGNGGGDPASPGPPGATGGSPGGVPGGTGAPAMPVPKPPPPAPKPPAPQPKPEPAVDVKALLASYASGLKSSIIRHKAYPAVAERLGHEGAVKVSFTVDASGALGSVTVKSSSGFDELDAAALDAVRAAAPFDPIPSQTGKDQLSLSITLKFNLGS